MIGNLSTAATPLGTYDNLLTVSFANDPILANYAISGTTQLEVVAPRTHDVHVDDAIHQGLMGAWAPYRRPLLDVRYLEVKGSEGINRHVDAPEQSTSKDKLHLNGVTL
jgi:hypothetical protein